MGVGSTHSVRLDGDQSLGSKGEQDSTWTSNEVVGEPGLRGIGIVEDEQEYEGVCLQVRDIEDLVAPWSVAPGIGTEIGCNEEKAQCSMMMTPCHHDLPPAELSLFPTPVVAREEK